MKLLEKAVSIAKAKMAKKAERQAAAEAKKAKLAAKAAAAARVNDLAVRKRPAASSWDEDVRLQDGQ